MHAVTLSFGLKKYKGKTDALYPKD